MENHSTPLDVFMNPPPIPYHVPPYQKAPIPKNVLLYQKQQEKLMNKKPITDHRQNMSTKPQRIRWDAKLHSKFVQVVNLLGGQHKATPNNILYYMNMERLTLPQIKSHLQKFRQGGPKKLENGQGIISKEVRKSISHIFEASSSTPSVVTNRGQHMVKGQMSNNVLKQMVIQVQSESELESHSYEGHGSTLPYNGMVSFRNVGIEGLMSAADFPYWNPVPHSSRSYDMQTPFLFGGSIAGEREHEGNPTNHMIGDEIQQLLRQEHSELGPYEGHNSSLPHATMGSFEKVGKEGLKSAAIFPSWNPIPLSFMSIDEPNFTINKHNYLLGGSVAEERQYEGNIAETNDDQIMRNQNPEEEMEQLLMQSQVEAESQTYEVHSSSIPYTMMASFGDVVLPSGDPVPPSFTSSDLKAPLSYTPNYSNGNTNLFGESFAGEGEQEENLAATYLNFDADNVVSLSNFNGD